MAIMRRGACAAEAAGAKDSNRGRATVKPAAFRNLRRFRVREVISFFPLEECMPLFISEHLTLDDFVDQGAEAVILRREGGDDLLDRVAVGEFHLVPGGEDEQFLRQAAGDSVLVLE